MNKIGITGVSGFIGTHLLKRLTNDEMLLGRNAIKYADQCRTLFFLSTYGNMASHEDHYEMVKANVIDLISTISMNPKHLIFMSSSSVLLPVQTPYSRTKRAAEEILQALPELKSCIVRPYSVTGVGEQKEHLIPTLIRSCMEGEEMPFDPSPVHDFVDVEDVVERLIRLADEQATGIHEFGRGIPYTNYEIKQRVECVTGKKANVKYVEGVRSYDNNNWFCKNPNPMWRTSKHVYDIITDMVVAYKNEHA